MPVASHRVMGKVSVVLSTAGRAMGDFFFPRVCMVCDADTASLPLCPDCEALIYRIESHFCQLCGQPLASSRRSHLCRECVRTPLSLKRIRAWARFTYPVDRLVYTYKYRRFPGLARFFAARLAGVVSSDAVLKSAHALVPIPLYALKAWWRGYNQSFLLSTELSRLTGIRTKNCLRRRKATRTQTRLDAAQRRANVAGAFVLKHNPPDLTGFKLIVVDDVITSGATLDAAAEVLLSAGAGEVYGLTIGGAWRER